MKQQSGRRAFLQTVAAGILGRSVAVGQSTSAVSSWTGGQTNSVLNQARPANDSPLKVTKVEPVVLRLNARNEDLTLYPQDYLMCRIETEDGIVGWGEGTNWPKVATVATEIEMNKHLVIGQSAWDIEKIWNTIFRTRTEMHGSHVQSAISAIDIALWDIVGQKLGVPVYKLIGGKVNDKLRIYTSYRWGDIPRTAEAYAKRTRELIAEGATAGKFDPFFEPYDFYLNLEASTKTIHEVAELIRGIREGGPLFDICVEAHAKFNAATAGRITRLLEPYDPFWLEEPVPAGNVEAMLQVQRATSIPIAAGERLNVTPGSPGIFRTPGDSRLPTRCRARRRNHRISQNGCDGREPFHSGCSAQRKWTHLSGGALCTSARLYRTISFWRKATRIRKSATRFLEAGMTAAPISWCPSVLGSD